MPRKPAPAATSAEERLTDYVLLIIASGQKDAIKAAELVLSQIANGAAALRYVRMHPALSEEVIKELLLGMSMSRKGRRKQ